MKDGEEQECLVGIFEFAHGPLDYVCLCSSPIKRLKFRQQVIENLRKGAPVIRKMAPNVLLTGAREA